MAVSSTRQQLMITQMESNCVTQMNISQPYLNQTFLGKCEHGKPQTNYAGHRLKEFRGYFPFGVMTASLAMNEAAFIS